MSIKVLQDEMGFVTHAFTRSNPCVSKVIMRKPWYNFGWEITLDVKTGFGKDLSVRFESLAKGYYKLYKVTGDKRELLLKVPNSIEDEEFVKLTKLILPY